MGTFELNLTREGERIRISATGKPQQTLRQYEYKDVRFDKVDALCGQILSILNRSNRWGEVAYSLISDLKKSGQDLFDELLSEQAKKSVLSTSCDTLSLNIDDRLIHIPWELLYDGTRFFCRRFNIGRRVSTKQDISGSQSRAFDSSIRMLIIADPDESLAAAYEEGIRIRDELAGKEKTIKAELVSSRVDRHYVRQNIRDYDIVHYTGHAEYTRDDPSRSGWLLSDGIWTSQDIRTMKGDTPFPFLMFSNACHSGRTGQVGEEYEKEIYDLAGTFLHCGVTHYIGTFLEIQDTPGSAFAVEFYRAIGRKSSVGEAVRIAREKMVEHYGESNIIWASYMLYGDPSYAIPCEEPRVASGAKKTPVVFYAITFMIILVSVYLGVKHLDTSSSPPVPIRPDTGIQKHVPAEIAFVSITGVRNENGTVVHETLTEGRRMYVYDTFRFLFTGNDAFFYLLTSDSTGKINLLYSGHGDRSEDASEEAQQTIPLEAHILKLDERPSAETIYILAADSQVADVEPMLWEIENVNMKITSRNPGGAGAVDDQSGYTIVARITIKDGRVESIQ